MIFTRNLFHSPRMLIETLESRRLLAAQSPFYGVPYSIPISIQAEQYDSGGSRVSYRDSEGANLGDANYRAGGVDFDADPNTPGNYFVSHTSPGEWLEYTINVEKTGYYRIETRLSCGGTGGTFHIYVDNVDKTGTRRVSNTGGWDIFKSVPKNGVKLTAGRHTMRLEISSANTPGGEVANLDWIRIKPSAPQQLVPQSINWRTKADALQRREEAVSFVFDDKLYSIGGYIDTPAFRATREVEAYDPVTNQWTRLGDAPTKLTHAGVAIDEKTATVWLIGGFIGDFPDVGGPDGTSAVWKYHPKTDTWEAGPSLPSARGAGGAGIVGRDVYYFGGANKGRTADMKDTFFTNVDTGTTWSKAANMPNPRNHLGAVTYNGNIYAIGGQHLLEAASINQSEVDLFDPTNNVWRQVASMPVPYSHFTFSTGIYDRFIVVLGGESPHGTGREWNYVFDPYYNSWKQLTDLPDARRSGIGGIIGDTIVFSGGYLHSLGQTTTTWCADISSVLPT